LTLGETVHKLRLDIQLSTMQQVTLDGLYDLTGLARGARGTERSERAV
jgi:hypothetical protein